MSEKVVKLEVKYVAKQYNLGWFGKVTKYETAEFLGSVDLLEETKRDLNVLKSEGDVVWYDYQLVNKTDFVTSDNTVG